MDKDRFKAVDVVEGKTDIDPKKIKNWRRLELHISFPPIAVFDISLVEPSEFRWNSLSLSFFLIKLNLFHILCTKQDCVAPLEVHPERAFLWAG